MKGVLEHRFPDLIQDHEQRLLDNFLVYDQAGQSNDVLFSLDLVSQIGSVYPCFFSDSMLNAYEVDEVAVKQIIQSHYEENPEEGYPSSLGKELNQDQKERLTLYIVRKRFSSINFEL